MVVLGIETSCDETSCALVKDGKYVLSHVIASSAELHAKTGGIIPENAAREQIKSMLPVLNETLEKAFPNKSHNDYKDEIDAIAVTYGPGLIGSLLVGVETAKTLSFLWDKPLIPVNHLVAHIYAAWIDDKKNKNTLPKLPALALVVSGGHTDLVYMKTHSDFTWIGGTRDDAAGEAFDKTARLLDLPYPGGPSIAKESHKFFSKQKDASKIKLKYFPRPMIGSETIEWSFSGLKTAVLNEVKNMNISPSEREKYAAEIQESIVDILVNKSLKAVRKYDPMSFILAGGVAANERLREKFIYQFSKSKMKTTFHVAQKQYCTDNAAMIATAAYYQNKPLIWNEVSANPQLEIVTI